MIRHLSVVGAAGLMITGWMAWSGVAWAGTVVLDEAKITRSVVMRDAARNPMWISHSDCAADDVMTFPLTVSGYGALGLGAWAGKSEVDCTPVSARSGPNAVCWQLLAPTAPASEQLQVSLHVRDIVGQHLPPQGPGSGTAADCEVSNPSSDAPVGVTVFFMLVDAAGEQYGGNAWKTKWDLVGPVPPTNLAAAPGQSKLDLSWTPSTSTDLIGYDIFADPTPGADAGAWTSQSSCALSKLVAGAIPPDAQRIDYASGSTTTAASVSGLQTGNWYSIALAGVDSVGNNGKLSTVPCATPASEGTPDGGTEGGTDGGTSPPAEDTSGSAGGCSMSDRSPGNHGMLGLLSLLALGMLARRGGVMGKPKGDPRS